MTAPGRLSGESVSRDLHRFPVERHGDRALRRVLVQSRCDQGREAGEEPVLPAPAGLAEESGVNVIFHTRASSNTPSYMSAPSSALASVIKRLTLASFN